jgi:hypothetical protein
MINTGLDRKFIARQDTDTPTESKRSYEPMPEGTYPVRVLEITPWEKQVKDINVIVRDEKGKIAKDEEGNSVRKLTKNVEYYNTNVTLEITGGDYENRRLWTNLTTHPNASFITDNFLYAIGAKEMVASDIPTKAIGKTLDVVVEISSYERKITDPDTGLERTETRTKNEVKSFRKPSKLDDTDLF